MQIQVVVLLLLSFISIVDGDNDTCQFYENNIYQLTSTLPGYAPYFILLTLVSNGIFFEETNIQNGQSSAELGVHLAFGTRTGYYECLDTSILHLTNFGYIFKNYEIPILATNGALVLQDYYLYFNSDNNETFTGQLNSVFYTTGVNPFNGQNSPIYTYPVRNITGVLLVGRHYVWPAYEV